MSFVGNLSVFTVAKECFANRSRIDTVITMVKVAHFFDSRCMSPFPCRSGCTIW